MLAKKLQDLIEFQGWSVSVTADRSGVNTEVIYRILNETTLDPRLSTLTGLSKAFNVTIDELVQMTPSCSKEDLL